MNSSNILLKNGPGVLALALCAALFFGAAYADDRTYAEKLGWGPDDKVVMFHDDDPGMAYSVNLGSIEAIENGVVTSVSIMMPCAWVDDFVDYLEENPDVCAGLHLTLTSEFSRHRWGPLSGIDVVPGLVDEDGYFYRSVIDVVRNATADEVEKEIRTQIDMAERMGIDITHLDSHMGTLFSSPEFFERYVKVGIEKNIPILLATGLVGETDPRLAFLRQAADRVWDAGLPVLDYLHAGSYDWDGDKTDKYIELLESLEPGLTQIIVHAARPTEDFDRFTSSGPTRYADLRAMTDPRLREYIEEEGIILTSWRELKERRDRVAEEEAAE